MIKKFKTPAGSVGTMAFFGSGTVRIHGYVLKSRYGAQLELTECSKTEVGFPVTEDKIVEKTNKIVLDFASVKALDEVIRQLRDVREELINERG